MTVLPSHITIPWFSDEKSNLNKPSYSYHLPLPEKYQHSPSYNNNTNEINLLLSTDIKQPDLLQNQLQLLIKYIRELPDKQNSIYRTYEIISIYAKLYHIPNLIKMIVEIIQSEITSCDDNDSMIFLKDLLIKIKQDHNMDLTLNAQPTLISSNVIVPINNNSNSPSNTPPKHTMSVNNLLN